MDYADIKGYLSSKRVLFATNGEMEGNGSSLMHLSLNTYKTILDGESNIIAVDAEHGRYYGYSAFKAIIGHAMAKGFDYVIYIDTDCFIVDLAGLFGLFRNFAESGAAVFSGMPDGGVISHRNGNRFSINPFLSFFNIGIIKGDFVNGGGLCFNGAGADGIRATEHTIRSLDAATVPYREWRESRGFSTPHSMKISGSGFDNQHIFTPNQKVWTFDDGLLTAEPYYRMFLSAHDGTHSIDYMVAKDYVGECDPSGITTAVLSCPNFDADDNIVCLHTWFSRLYSENATGGICKETTDRIRSVYDYCMDRNGASRQV